MTTSPYPKHFVGQALLIYRSPEIVLSAVDLDEDFLDVECITVTAMLALQSASVHGSKLVAPEADCFSGNSDSTFSKEIFDIPVTWIKAEIEPDGVADYVRRESMPLICVHPPILSIPGS